MIYFPLLWGLNTMVPNEMGKASLDTIVEVGSYYTRPAYKSGGLMSPNRKCDHRLRLSHFHQDDKSTKDPLFGNSEASVFASVLIHNDVICPLCKVVLRKRTDIPFLLCVRVLSHSVVSDSL